MLRFTRANRQGRAALLSATAALALCGTAAEAAAGQDTPEVTSQQTATPPQEGDAPGLDASDTSNEGQEIIVTGTSRARAALDTPLAVSTLDDDRLARLSSSSQGDILNTIPTIKADAGGGEVATNVFIKGLPS